MEISLDPYLPPYQTEIHQVFIQMVPPSVAEELIIGREVAPKQFRTVTISFVDIANFYSLISGMEPLDVTKMMKALYKYVRRIPRSK